MLLENDAVKLNFHTNKKRKEPHFLAIRQYHSITYINMTESIDDNQNPTIQSIFASQNPEESTTILLGGLHQIVKKLK